MKRVLVILVLGLFGFLALAMLQEWRVFATAWLGAAPELVRLSEDDRREAADTVREYLTILTHVHGGEGDARFLDRLPASDLVIGELVEDLEYLRRNGRRQTMRLQRLEVQAVDQLDERSFEVRTREWWTIGYARLGSGEPLGRRSASVVGGRFLVVREASSWTIRAAEALDSSWLEPAAAPDP